MQIYLSDLSPNGLTEKTAVALGQFDAMHIGHTAIIGRTVEYAKENSLKSLVFMFENDPLEVICGREPMAVNSLQKRTEILRELGVDIVVIKKFDRGFMELEGIDFIDEYLVRRFNAGFVAAGFNYKFGKGAGGSTDLLKAECGARGIEVCILPEITLDDKTVSTTRIKSEISDGNVDKAAKLMGRYYSVDGTVKEGNRLGKKVLGFPTANIEIPTGRVVPAFGVYIAVVRLGGERYPAICNIGEKPTVENNYLCIEAHIDGEFGELYGKDIEVEFCKFIRKTQRFDSLEKLAEQLAADKSAAQKFFADTPAAKGKA